MGKRGTVTEPGSSRVKNVEEPQPEGRPARGSTVFTFRLSREELAALEQAAAQAGASVSEYLRRAAAMRPASSVLAKPQVSLSINTPYNQSGRLVAWSESPTTLSEWSVATQGDITLRE